jgi:hypothetical protein
MKKSLTLFVEIELIQKARQHGLVISKFLENHLIEYFTSVASLKKIKTINAGNGIRTRVTSLGS